jgi:hypothetical protein
MRQRCGHSVSFVVLELRDEDEPNLAAAEEAQLAGEPGVVEPRAGDAERGRDLVGPAESDARTGDRLDEKDVTFRSRSWSASLPRARGQPRGVQKFGSYPESLASS